MLLPKDKEFIAAAKQLGLLNDDQLRACVKVLAERRALGVERDLGEVALDTGLIDAAALKRIQAAIKQAQAVRASGSAPELRPAGAAPAAASAPAAAALRRSPGRPAPAPAPAPPPAAPGAPAGAASDRVVPDQIENYQILGRIGEGAMAAVYRARHRVLDKDIALKVLAPELSRDQDYVARFLREARAAAKLDHPNLVRIHDAGESRGRHYIAMELVEGIDLEKLVARDGPLSEIAALEIGREVARALSAAAEAKIVHRDVKPENIVRTPEGRIKLLDLGLAREQRRKDEGSITEAGKTLGTPFFVSPEQAKGEELDTRSDLYSLGVTLFYLTTGEHPFTGAAPAEVMKRHVTDPAPSVRVLRPSLSPGFDALVQKLMAKDPTRRYQTPHELIAAIELVLSGEGSAPELEPAAPADSGERRRAAGSGPGAGAGSAAGAAAGPAAGAAPRRSVARPLIPKTVVPEETTPIRTKLLMAIGGLTFALLVLIVWRSALGDPPIPPREIELAERSAAGGRGSASGARAGEVAGPAGGATAGDPASDATMPPPAGRFETDLAHMREYEARREYAKARLIMERVIQTYGNPIEKRRAGAEIARLREAERLYRKSVVSAPDVPPPDGPEVAPAEKKPEAVDPFDPFAGGGIAPAGDPPAPASDKTGPPAAPPISTGDPLAGPAAPPAGGPSSSSEPGSVATPVPPPAVPPAAEPPKARTRFDRVYETALEAPFTNERDRALTIVYAFGKGSEGLLADWEPVKHASAHSAEDGYRIDPAAGRSGRWRHVVPFATPFTIEAKVKRGGRFSFIFGDLKAGIDYAAATDLSLAKRKNGEPIKTYRKPAPGAAAALDPEKEVALALTVDQNDQATLVVDGKTAFEKVAIPDGIGPSHVGFEIDGGGATVKEITIRAQPDPAWLVERMRTLPSD